MKKFFILVILFVAAYKGYQNFYDKGGKAFDDDGNPTVVLFVHDGCGAPCDDALRLLNHRHVDYERISVSDGDAQVRRWEAFGSVREMPYMVAGNEKVVGYNKWEMVSALAIVFDNTYLTRSEEAIFSKNFTADGKPKLVMYTMDGCGYCDQARRHLQQEGIGFEERNTSHDYVAYKELQKFQSGTPLIFYGYRRFVGWGDNVRKGLMNVL